MPLFDSNVDDVYLGSVPVDRVYQHTYLVWEGLPPAVSSVTVGDISQAGTLTVSWSAVSAATHYYLYRNGILISQSSSRAYYDSGLDWEKDYIYTVVSHNETGASPDSTSSPVARISSPSNTPLTASNRTTSNVTVSWSAVSGATHYQVYLDGVAQGFRTATSFNVPMAEDQTKAIFVRPIRNGVIGTSSGVYTYYSGRKEVRDSGTWDNMQFGPSKLDSWRSVDYWDWLSGIAAQGTYGTYGSYQGVVYYGPNGVRDTLRSALGSTAREVNGWCSGAAVYLYKRPGVGSSGAVSIGIYRSNSDCTGGKPTGVGGITRESPVSDKGAWVEIGTAHGDALAHGSYKSLLFSMDGTANYAQFQNGTLLLNWNWNYLVTAAANNVWSTP
jgi:hypothetical protein